MHRASLLLLAPWTRAPARLLRMPALFVPVAVTATVVGLAVASRPMFVSSTASGVLEDDLRQGCAAHGGLRLARSAALASAPNQLGGRPPGVDVDDATAALDEAVENIAGLAPPVVTLEGAVVTVEAPGSIGRNDVVRLASRTGFRDHVQVVARGEERGIWLPDTVADAVGAKPGSTVELVAGGARAAIPVEAVFRDLARVERDRYWCSMERSFEEFHNLTPPPLALIDQEMLLGVASAHATRASVSWEYSPSPDGWTLQRAEEGVASLRDVLASASNDQLPLGEVLGRGPGNVDSLSSVNHARRAVAIVEAAAGPVSLATAGVGLLMLVLAARAWVDHRRRELVVLALRGAGAPLLCAKGVLEMAPPIILGAATGAAAAWVAVRGLGPAELIEGRAVRTGLLLVGIGVAAALIAVAVTVASVSRHITVDRVDAAPGRRVLWEPVALALAAAAFYELQAGGARRGAQVDSFVLMFPILLLSGAGGLLARFALRAVPADLAQRLPTSLWLALRRLSARRRQAIPVITAATVSMGVVVFASTTSQSFGATIDAKALLGPGTETVLLVEDELPLPESGPLRDISTYVSRTTEASVLRESHARADVIGIDPATFDRGAYWDESFAGRSLRSLLEDLTKTDGGPARALAVGDGLPERFSLTLRGERGPVQVPVRVAARPEFFPGFARNSSRPLVVVRRDVLSESGVDGDVEMWVDSRDPGVIQQARDAGLSVLTAFAARDRLQQGDLQPQGWALTYLEVVGLAAGAITLSGIGVYFATDARRRRIGAAVARRVGLPARQSFGAIALEIALMLGTGLLGGTALAGLAAWLLRPHLDPLPQAPPAPILRFDAMAVVLCAAAVALLAMVVSAGVERFARHRPLPSLLRDAS